MIWGQTYEEVRLKKEKRLLTWFAWYPVTLTDGRWAWLCRVRCVKVYHYEGSSYSYTEIEK